MAFKKLTQEEKDARKAAKDAQNAVPKEKKARKVREPGPKAPKRSEAPAAFAAYEVERAKKIVAKIDNATSGWGSGAAQHFTDALASLDSVVASFLSMPADFKPARKGGKGGPGFTVGQRVELSADAMARVQQLFPDVKGDCVFNVAKVRTDKLYAITCSGVDGSLPPFFVDAAKRKDLTASSVPA